jgi:lysozyme
VTRGLWLLLLIGFVGCGGTHHPVAIPRDRIIFPPGGSVHPEVTYPNGEVSKGAFKLPPLPTLSPPSLIPHKYVGQPGLTLQRDEEGFESCPYWDPYGGVWTIGIGEAYVSSSRPCESEAQAYVNLRRQDDEKYSWPIWDLNIVLNQNEFDALIDFDYNLGPYIFQISPSITIPLEHYRFSEAWDVMDGYDKAGGVVLGDLYRRRLHERSLFFKYSPPPETPAQIRARELQELASHEREIHRLRVRIAVLKGVLGRYGCRRRMTHHLKTGPICKRWRGEAVADHLHGLREDAIIAHLHKELK